MTEADLVRLLEIKDHQIEQLKAERQALRLRILELEEQLALAVRKLSFICTQPRLDPQDVVGSQSQEIMQLKGRILELEEQLGKGP